MATMVDRIGTDRPGEAVYVKLNGNSTYDAAGREYSNGTHDNILSKENQQYIRGDTIVQNSANGYDNGPTDRQNGFIQKSALHIVDSRTGLEYDIPIKHNAVQAVDFKRIKANEKEGVTNPYDNLQNGLRILDSGFQNTAVKESNITFIDGQKGMIYYRGHSIVDLIGKKYEEVIYLLIWGRLPSEQERTIFSMSLASYPLPSAEVFSAIRAFPPGSPPVLMIIAGLAALDACRPEYIPAYKAENLYMAKTAAVDHQIIRSIASLAVISAIVYCHNQHRVFTPPDVNCSYIENLLLMMGHVEKDTGRPNPKSVGYVERLWILTADHEMTHSTAAFLHTASSLNDPLISLISGFSASWGILHGGAIEVAYKHIQKVGNVNAVHDMIEDVKAGKGRLFGYGHRIYKTIDPRYASILEILNELSGSLDVKHDPILSVALEIDRVASSDEYFTSRHLHANADLLASFVYKALGFPADFILPLSSISRTPGTMAHWREAMNGPARLWRPQQIYTGTEPIVA